MKRLDTQAQNPLPVRLIAPCDLEVHVKFALGTLAGPTGNSFHDLRSSLNQCGCLPRAPALGALLFAFATANNNSYWPRREEQHVCFFNAVISHTLNDGGKRKGGGEMKSDSWSGAAYTICKSEYSSIPLLRLRPAFSEIQKILSVNCENLLEWYKKEQIHLVSLYHFGVALLAPQPLYWKSWGEHGKTHPGFSPPKCQNESSWFSRLQALSVTVSSIFRYGRGQKQRCRELCF